MDEEGLLKFIEDFDEAVENSETEMVDIYFSTNGGVMYTLPIWIDFIEKNHLYISRFILIENCDSLGIFLVDYIYRNFQDILYISDTFSNMTLHKVSFIGEVNNSSNIDFNLYDKAFKDIFSEYLAENPSKELLFDSRADIDLCRQDVMRVFKNIKTRNYISR